MVLDFTYLAQFPQHPWEWFNILLSDVTEKKKKIKASPKPLRDDVEGHI